MKLRKALLVIMLLVFLSPAAAEQGEEPMTIRVGSKTFTESVILGEIIKHRARKNIDLRVWKIRSKLSCERVIVGDVSISLRELPEA